MTFDNNEIVKESGLPGIEVKPPGMMPAGEGQNIVPHYMTFSGLYNLASRTYRYTFDDALRASPTNARAMRRDPVLMQALRARQMPTAQLSWHLEPVDETDNAQADALEKVTQIIHAIPRFQQLKMNLLEAIWYGRYGCQLLFSWDYTHGEKRMVVKDHIPVMGDKLFFKWSGDVGILVNSMYPKAKEITDRGMCHFLTPEERECFIVNRFEPEDADFFEPELGGGIEGVGVRGRLYWFWFLKQNFLALLTNYLERCALGFTIYYFDAGNSESAAEVEAYAKSQIGQNSILFPRYREYPTGGYGIQRVEPGTAGAQLLENLVTGYFDDVMRRYILGQDLSSESGPTGMGGAIADLHADTLSRIVKYDAVNLSETLTTDLVRTLYKYNCPNVPPAKFVFDIDTPNAGEVLGYAQTMYEMGMQIDGDEIYEISGLSKPGKNSNILSKLGAMQPTAVNAQIPEGVPVQGQPGPQQQQQDDSQHPADTVQPIPQQ